MGLDGFTWHSMTGAESTRASVCNPRMRSRLAGLTPRTIASPMRRLSMRWGMAPLMNVSSVVDMPPETMSGCPVRRSAVSASSTS